MNSYWKGKNRGISHFKGKTYEEIYGKEKANQQRQKRSISISNSYKSGKSTVSKKRIQQLIIMNKKKKGKTYKEIYGKKRALEETQKRKHPGKCYRPSGYKHSDKTKRKIGNGNRGLKRTKEQKEKYKTTNRVPHLAARGKPSSLKGKTFEEIMKNKKVAKERAMKISKSHKGIPRDEATKYKLRLAAVEQQKRDRGEFKSNVGKNETKILDLLELKLGYPIIRQYPIYGYFVDGYCKENNTVYEVDEKKHFQKGTPIKKDLHRQKNIIEKLNCNFVRIKEDDFINKLKDLI